LKFSGVLSQKEIIRLPGIPSLKRLSLKKGVAVIECAERITCNPCEAACPQEAIKVGDDITNFPILFEDRYTGCGLCIPACLGLAIFVVNGNYSHSKALVSIPYEFLSLPKVGDQVKALNREGKTICSAEVIQLKNTKKFDRTPIVSFTVPKEKCMEVRHILTIRK